MRYVIDPAALILDEMKREGYGPLADRYAEIQSQKIDYVKDWRRAGHPVPGSLWSAACYTLQARETERLFEFARDVGARPEFLSGLLDDIERAWERAHKAYLADEDDRHVA